MWNQIKFLFLLVPLYICVPRTHTSLVYRTWSIQSYSLSVSFGPQTRDPWAFYIFLYLWCVCVLVRVYSSHSSSFRSASPLPICWLPFETAAPSPPLPPFSVAPSSLLPPCSLIPPSLKPVWMSSGLLCKRGTALAAVRLTGHCRLAPPRVLWLHWSVFRH